MSRLLYSGVNIPNQQVVQCVQQPAQIVQCPAQQIVQCPAQQIVQAPVQQIVQAPVQTTQVVQAPVVQQTTAVVEGPPQSQGPFQTGVRQEATQLGESRFEYIPKERTWIEYETQTHTEYVPKEVKLTDHYAVEHITELVPQVYQDTYVDYHPQERFQERVEYQQVNKRIVHPSVSSEITEQILAPVAGPSQLIPSASQVIETGATENINHVQQSQAVIQQPIQVQAPVQQVQQVQQVIQPQVIQQRAVAPLVGSRIAPVVGSRVVPAQQFVQQAPCQFVQQAPCQYLQPAVVQAPVVNTSRVVIGNRPI